MEILSQEIQFLQGYSENNGACGDVVTAVQQGTWNSALNGDILHSLIEFLQSNKECTDFTEEFLKFAKDNIIDSVEGHREFVVLGIVCLKLFMQANWTGPPVDVESLGPLSELLLSKELNERSFDTLESNGDEMYQLVKYPTLLLIAYMILVECSKKLNLFSTLPIWSVKCIAIYCHVIDEIKETHLKMLQGIFDKVHQESRLKNLPTEVIAEFYLCCYHLYLECYNYGKAKECLNYVKNLLHIEVSLTASLGKRTKFQVKDIPQMKLDITLGKDRDPIQSRGEVTQDIPTDVLLDNDTLLPHIKFVDDNNVKNMELSPLDQAFIICNCIYIQKTSPRDKLSHEELLPFLDTVLMSPQCWSVQAKSLFLRCITEMSNARKIERSMSQLESLVKTFNKTTPQAYDRHSFAQAVHLQPQWTNERVHAQCCVTYGCVDTALEIFLRLYMWDDVISCYQRMGKHGKAEEVIRKQLDTRESATLWCLLGDVTLDKSYYEKAWEFSKHRNARSQRSLGQWHLRRNEFQEAIPYFQKSLELNCLQPGIAFSLGCSCMSINHIQVAARAFQSCVQLEPENSQAWNNLASNYIRLGQIQKGYKALQEASRLSYDNWKIWENFLLVATDIGAFDDSIQCCHRLVDLRRKTIDVEALDILVTSTIKEELDMHGISASRLKPKLFKLFGHITSQITDDPNVWEIYAKLCLSNDDPPSNEKALQYLYKSHRCYTQHTDWEKSEAQVGNVMRVTLKMMEVTREVCAHAEFKQKTLSLASTTKMALSNLTIRLKKAFCDNDEKPLPTVQPHIMDLENHTREMQVLIDSCP